jgi:hypothetical protein
LSPIRAICPAHLIFRDFITHITFGEEHRSWISSLCSLLQSPVTSTLSLVAPNIPQHTPFSNIRSLCSYLIVKDQVLHPKEKKTTEEIIILYLCPVQVFTMWYLHPGTVRTKAWLFITYDVRHCI